MMGKGSLHSVLRKQKLNTKSSNKAELVGADDGLNDLLWTQNFLKAQGHESKLTVLFQDNTNAKALAKGPVTWTFVTSLLRTELNEAKCRLSFAQLMT